MTFTAARVRLCSVAINRRQMGREAGRWYGEMRWLAGSHRRGELRRIVLTSPVGTALTTLL